MAQATITSIGKIKMPARMLRAYKHSTNEDRKLFDFTYERLIESGLSLYPTDCPDLRARHPQNDIVFVVMGFQEVAGTRIEVRVDSCPVAFYRSGPFQPHRLRNYDPKTRALWAVYPIQKQSEIDAVVTVIERVKKIRPNWGNTTSAD